jgi:hypothetical protein
MATTNPKLWRTNFECKGLDNSDRPLASDSMALSTPETTVPGE